MHTQTKKNEIEYCQDVLKCFNIHTHIYTHIYSLISMSCKLEQSKTAKLCKYTSSTCTWG